MITETTSAATVAKRSRTGWLVPAGLIFISIIPVIFGSLRLAELARGAAVTPANERFFDSPIPVLIHIPAVIIYSLLGAFQFVPSLRRGKRGSRNWHRISGVILIPAGLLSALSGLWMAVFYDLPPDDGVILLILRLVFGTAMTVSIVLGILAIRRRNFAAHGAWMARGYAIGIAAGTQALVSIPWILLIGPTNELSRAVLLGAAWLLNLAVAEYFIGWRAQPSGQSRRVSGKSTATPGRSFPMRAAVYRKFGPPEVVSVAEIPQPSPGLRDVLVKVHASTVSAADYRSRGRDVPKGLGLLAAKGLGLFRPRNQVLGMDFAGVVVSVGPEVTKFHPGDKVVGMLGAKFGGHAEYVCLPEDGAITVKPRNMDFEEAVTLVFGGLTALNFLNAADLKPGDTVLINGASGAVGTAAVQLAKQLGAHVTGVSSAANAELVSSIGADRVIDYAQTDFTQEGKTYDVIMDCVGNAPFERVEASLIPGGSLLLVIGDLKAILLASSRTRKSGKKVVVSSKYSADDLKHLVYLGESGHYRAVIDRTYNLEDIVEAHRFADTGRKAGNVVVRIAPAATGKTAPNESRLATKIEVVNQ
ncbi:DUF2306 domain-containing protein [Arthrobacter sulfonylureivorans]|uniref:DUF2306 domain-containing protein n=1 Tax=Arthrobacter sulfonylureivorans TaxID=2486855 RepID=A0ABY3W4V9_9MICC|nr:DUF2306 domain-containing protein [Arthrobacter sulfonylureivorans]UNK45220.1 DUF2306 domain-containing protein [Arthrobacter sulfonylureivorans]